VRDVHIALTAPLDPRDNQVNPACQVNLEQEDPQGFLVNSELKVTVDGEEELETRVFR